MIAVGPIVGDTGKEWEAVAFNQEVGILEPDLSTFRYWSVPDVTDDLPVPEVRRPHEREGCAGAHVRRVAYSGGDAVVGPARRMAADYELGVVSREVDGSFEAETGLGV